MVGYRSGADEAEEVAEAIGGKAVQADISDPEQAARLVEEAGELHVLVNNAGLTRDGLIARMPDEDWREVIDTNLGGVFHTCRAAARGMMKRRSGSIVNISSIVGVHGNPGPDELLGGEGRDHRLHEVARARARLARRARQRGRAGLRVDATHRRAA